MTDENGQPLSLEWVPLAKVRIPSYQRDPGNIGKLVKSWDIRACGAMTTSFREGVYWTVDGQRRSKAANRLGIEELPSVVLREETEASEALLYLNLNVDRLAMRPIQRHQAEVVAKVPRALAIRDVMLKHGLVVAKASVAEGRYYFQAIVAVERVYDEGGAELLDRVLNVISAAFPDELKQLKGAIVRGLGYFLARDPGDATDDQVAQALSKVTITQIEVRATHAKAASGGHGHGGGSPVYIARTIASEVYRGPKGEAWMPKRLGK